MLRPRRDKYRQRLASRRQGAQPGGAGTHEKSDRTLLDHAWGLMVILFLILGWGLARANGGQGLKLSVNSLIGTVVGAVLLGCLIIMSFYLRVD